LIKKLEAIKLSKFEQESFAKSCILLRFGEHLQVNYEDLLLPHRSEDCKDDLYTTLNVIQENLLKGNISGINQDTGRRFTSKEITSISKDVNVNKGLWEIAEKIASIKEPELALVA